MQCTQADAFIYIADNPVKDFAAPHHLGWSTVRIRRAGGLHSAETRADPAPDYEMNDCSGLADLIARL